MKGFRERVKWPWLNHGGMSGIGQGATSARDMQSALQDITTAETARVRERERQQAGLRRIAAFAATIVCELRVFSPRKDYDVANVCWFYLQGRHPNAAYPNQNGKHADNGHLEIATWVARRLSDLVDVSVIIDDEHLMEIIKSGGYLAGGGIGVPVDMNIVDSVVAVVDNIVMMNRVSTK